MKLLIVLLGFLQLNHLEAKDKFYKWTDTNGNTHYTDKKTENNKATEVKVTEPQAHIIKDASSDNDTSDKKIKPELTTQEKLNNYAKQDKARRQNAKIKRQRCRDAKNQLTTFKKSITYKFKDPKSRGTIYLDAKKKAKLQARNQKKIDRYQKNINKNCK